MMMQLSSKNIQNVSIPVILFLISFFCIVSLSLPGLQINDEWITANQVHQLALGHQPFLNEGKYGTLSDGSSPYFAYRHNILGYSLILPLLSLPSLIFILLLNDGFRFGIILLWTLIPGIIGLFVHVTYPQYAHLKKIPLIIPALIFSLFLLLTNIYLYTPFSASLSSAPIEAAAIILTNHILFSLTVVTLFYTGRKIFVKDNRYAIIGAISIVSCSSMLYWASDAKDHMLTIFLVCFILHLFISYIQSNNQIFAALTFFITGILTWTRPEVGFTIFFALLFSYWIIFLRTRNKKELYTKNRIIAFILPLIIIGGLIPFFVNNLYLTNNPLSPPALDMADLYGSQQVQEITNIDTPQVSNFQQSTELQKQKDPSYIISFLIRHFSPDPQVSFQDYLGVFFLPQLGQIMGFFPLSPLFLIGLVTLPMILITRWSKVVEADKMILILCFLMVIAVILTYLNRFQGLNTSEGVGPDVRYFSPMYIPGGFIGLLSMKYWRVSPLTISPGFCFGTLVIGAPLVIIVLLFFQPFGGGISQFNAVLSIISLILSLFLCLLFAGSERRGSLSTPLHLNYLLVLIVPLAWQIMLIFLYSIAKFDAYSYWIPLTGYFFAGFFTPVG